MPGTLNSCGSGMAPSGTYLSGEENRAFHFDGPAEHDADGTGRWLPLVQGQGPLTAAAGFPDQGGRS